MEPIKKRPPEKRGGKILESTNSEGANKKKTGARRLVKVQK